MRIAYVLQPWESVVLPVETGSVRIWTAEVGRRLASSSDVIVYGRQLPGQSREEVYDGVRYRRVPSPKEPWSHKPLRRVPGLWSPTCPFFASGWYYRAYARRIARDLRSQACDIIHVHNFSQMVPILRRNNPRARIVLHMHCEWLSQLDRAMIGRRLADVRAVLGCSGHVARLVGDRFPGLASRCHAIFNGVDADRFTPDGYAPASGESGDRTVLFVGRVSPEKGVHTLMGAFEAVAQREPRATLEIVGPDASAPKEFIIALTDDEMIASLASYYPGSYKARLQRQLPPALADRVSFIGDTPQCDLVSRYRRAKVLVNPSFSEAFGMSLIEAMACGIPVVATRVGGMTEIVRDGETGYLVDRGDSAGLASAIIRLLSDEPLRRTMGAEGRRRIMELFTWDRIAREVRHVYEELCNRDE